MPIVDDLFLLLTRDDGKPESAFTWAQYGYAAAAISDLVLAGRVSLDGEKDPRVRVVDPTPVGHPVLDGALARLRDKDGKRMSSLVGDGKVAPEAAIAAGLAQAGVVTIEEKRMLGLVPERRPVADPAPERAVRQRLAAVLAGEQATPHDATLLSLLAGLDVAPRILQEEAGSLSQRDLKERIRAVGADVEAGAAVKSVVESMNLMFLTTIFTPVIAGAAVSS